MEKPQLKDPDVYPSDKVLKKVLGNAYSVFGELVKRVMSSEYALIMDWRYYKDGNAWLCKVVHKKKTIFWLSIWEGYFKTTFYFTEKTGKAISDLSIDKKLKETFYRSKSIGRLIPLTTVVSDRKQIPDLLRIIDYKKNLK